MLTKLCSCLACGSDQIEPILDLGSQPLANGFAESIDSIEQGFPLAVNHCVDCHHLQLTHAVDPAIIYSNYLYVSGTSNTYMSYMDWYAGWTLERYGGQAKTVLDIGCNDGSQLDRYAKHGLGTYGVDPAINLLDSSTSKGHRVVCGFWNDETRDKLGHTCFDIITSQNAFAHVPDPLAYLKLTAKIMHDDSLLFISTSQADMVLNGEFDTIYHEHISFYNANSMNELAQRAGLNLVDTVKTPIHGVSYIFVLSKRPRPSQLANILAMEAMLGLMSSDTYHSWAQGVSHKLVSIPAAITRARQYGMSVVGYGAAAKGITLINSTGAELDAIVDDSPLKQGLFAPGSKIPIVGPQYIDDLPKHAAVLFVPLAWNFYSEIRSRILARRNQPQDRFLRYFPEIEIS